MLLAAMFSFTLREILIVGGGVAILALMLLLVAFMVMRGKPGLDPDAGLGEDLSEYPPSPKAGTHRLVFEGQPARLRLVVIAPAGRSVTLTAEMAEGLLQAVLHGLGEVADLDRPRVRVWPS